VEDPTAAGRSTDEKARVVRLDAEEVHPGTKALVVANKAAGKNNSRMPDLPWNPKKNSRKNQCSSKWELLLLLFFVLCFGWNDVGATIDRMRRCRVTFASTYTKSRKGILPGTQGYVYCSKIAEATLKNERTSSLEGNGNWTKTEMGDYLHVYD